MGLTFFELHNYWLPILWLLGAGLLFSRMPKKTELSAGQTVRRWHWFTALLVVLPLIIWAGTRGYFGDTNAYRRSFYNAPSSFRDLPVYMEQINEDRGFYLMMALLKCLGMHSSTAFFLLIAAVQLLLMVRTFRRYSDDFWLCIFLFVASTDYYSWMFNGMRQFLAAAIIFGFFDLLVERRYFAYALVILGASLFHASALIMLPITLVMAGRSLNTKTLLLLLGTIIVIPFINQFIPFLNLMLGDTQYSTIIGDDIWSVDDGTNIIRVLVYSVPALICMFGFRYVRQTHDPVMRMCVNAALITMAIYLISAVTSGIYVGRLPIYTTLQSYMALPWAIDRIFEKNTAKLIRLLMVVCYIAFYYYQMGITWALL